eukprot:scaffold94056_cov30-Tisochrysis_lutea.AAC.1
MPPFTLRPPLPSPSGSLRRNPGLGVRGGARRARLVALACGYFVHAYAWREAGDTMLMNKNGLAARRGPIRSWALWLGLRWWTLKKNI